MAVPQQLEICGYFVCPCIRPRAINAAATGQEGEKVMQALGATRKLFTPVQIGATSLKHRVVMAPLTRSR